MEMLLHYGVKNLISRKAIDKGQPRQPIDFHKHRKLAFAISWIIVAIGIFAVNAQKDEHDNPFEVDNSAVTSGGNNTADTDAGYIRLSVSGTNIVVKSCNTLPCSTASNREEKSIAFQ